MSNATPTPSFSGSVLEQPRRPWSVGEPPSTYVISNVRAVLPDRVTDSASVVVEDGRIAAVQEISGKYAGDVDGANRLLIPGLIDVHSDALERERAPRASAILPWDFALASFESKLVGAGVTTIFHGAGFQEQLAKGVERSAELAWEVCVLVTADRSHRVDHRILHRLDVRSEVGAQVLRRRLESLPPDATSVLVSHEDHTPGQGQYADREHFVNTLIAEGMTLDQARRHIATKEADAAHTMHVRDENLRWLGRLAAVRRIRLLGHDPDTADVVDGLIARGGTTAEFPTTVEAAERARELGLTIVVGAPNVLRGASHSGNVSAGELIAMGLADALASDYLPTALLGSVFSLSRGGVVSLPAAVRLVTSGPAAVAGLSDRGQIAEGMLADFALVDDNRGSWPHVITTMKSTMQR